MLSGGILPNAFLTTQTVVGGADAGGHRFRGLRDARSATGIYNATTSTNLATATATDNVKVSGALALAGSKTVNALLLDGNAAAVTLGGGVNLTLSAGTIISAAPFNTLAAPSITGGTVTLSRRHRFGRAPPTSC